MAGRDADTGGAGETGTLGLGAKVGGEETGCAASRFAALLCRRVGMTRTETLPRITLLASFIASRISMLPSPSLSSKPVLRPCPNSVLSGTASLTGVCSLRLSALPVTELRYAGSTFTSLRISRWQRSSTTSVRKREEGWVANAMYPKGCSVVQHGAGVHRYRCRTSTAQVTPAAQVQVPRGRASRTFEGHETIVRVLLHGDEDDEVFVFADQDALDRAHHGW